MDRDLEEERISVREYRRLAYGLDTPDMPDNPIKGALVFKSHDDFMEYAETHKKANPTIYSFAKTVLKITGNPNDFILVRDLYRLYQEQTDTWKAETSNKFVRRIKEIYPALGYKQKKVDGKPELVTGKRYKAHNGNDPGDDGDVFVCYYKMRDGGFYRHVIACGDPAQGHSGVGIYFWIADITGNGKPDIVAPGKEGLYIFTQA